SLSMIPACMVARRARWCFLATLTPSTITLPSRGKTRMTSPSSPRSFPESTRTRSPFLSLMTTSQNLWRQRDDPHELLVPELAPDRAEDAGATRLQLVVDQHRGVLVEADVRPVRPP